MPVISHCPNGHPIEQPGLRYCPTCGAALFSGASGPNDGLFTSSPFSDGLLGFAVALGPFIVGLIILPLSLLWVLFAWGIYFYYRFNRPSFARGLCIGLLLPTLLVLLVLGLLATCIGILVIGNMQTPH